MTIILTSLTADWMTQVCDSRISYKNAKPRDTARKMIFYCGHGANMTISYTGLAEVKEHNQPWRGLDEWLTETVARVAVDARSVDIFAQRMMKPLHQIVGSTVFADPRASRRLAVIISGFVNTNERPVVLCVSNYRPSTYGLSTVAQPQLTVVPSTAKSSYKTFEYHGFRTTDDISLIIHGNHAALTLPMCAEIHSALLGAHATDDPYQARSTLVETIGRIAGEAPTGNINSDCWSHIIRRGQSSSGFEWHFADPNKQTPCPSMIGLGIAISNVTLVQELPGYSDALAKLEAWQHSNKLPINKFDGPTALAYLDWSPRIKELAGIVENRGIAVESARMTYAPDVLTLLQIGHFQTISALEDHVSMPAPWVDEMIKEYADDVAVGHVIGSKGSIFKTRLLALVLVALNPDKYPSKPPPRSPWRVNDLEGLWPVDEKLIALAKHHNPDFPT